MSFADQCANDDSQETGTDTVPSQPDPPKKRWSFLKNKVKSGEITKKESAKTEPPEVYNGQKVDARKQIIDQMMKGKIGREPGLDKLAKFQKGRRRSVLVAEEARKTLSDGGRLERIEGLLKSLTELEKNKTEEEGFFDATFKAIMASDRQSRRSSSPALMVEKTQTIPEWLSRIR